MILRGFVGVPLDEGVEIAAPGLHAIRQAWRHMANDVDTLAKALRIRELILKPGELICGVS